jgi:two-component system NtrC family sensor kinase
MNPSPDIADHPARILIVDDERQNRQVLEVMLSPEGFHLLTAASGEEALAMVAQQPPDLILLDIMMPGMDGYQVTAKIKGNLATQNIPVIMVTAMDDRNATMLGLSAGAEDFLTKPVDRAELCVRVRNLLRLKAYGDYHGKYSEMLEGEVKRSEALLFRQEKLASLGRLAAGLAHELNNPLNTIAGFVEALHRRSQTESLQACKEFEDFPRFLSLVQTEVDRAAAIVRRLLDFARQREPSLELVDLGTLISKSVAFVDRQAAVANQRIIVEPLRLLVRVRADAQMLQQLLLNVLTNACDAIENGGEVRIAVGITKAQQGSPGQAEMATLSIADNGCGIAPENLTKIFDPFFTTKEVGKGTGLGLPICLSIVEQHEGTIEVKSEGVGKGTTVIVKLPVVEKVEDRE